MLWYPLSSTLWRARLGWASLTRPREGAFGPEQAAAWSAFYLGEERSASAAPSSAYARMLAQHGCPDVGNPVPNDDEGHFLIHPGGFVACEIDRCLRPAQSELDELRGERALERLGLMAHLGCPMLSARAYWADDDVRMAMALALVQGRWDLFGARPARAVVNAMRHGLLEPAAVQGVLQLRLMAESSWHQAPWLRGRGGAPRPTQPEAPALDVGAWRARRSGAEPPEGPPDPPSASGGLA